MKKDLIVSLGVALAATLVSASASARPRPQGEQPAPAPADQKAAEQKPEPCSKTNNVQPCTADETPAEKPKGDAADSKAGEAKPEEKGAKAESPSLTVTGPTSGEPAKDTAQAEAKDKPEEKKLPWRNSTLLFDQSMTTQTAQLEAGSPQQSYIPLYEWWISFRPRFYITDKLYTWARIDYFKEWTNSNETTYKREDVFGDIWLNLVYSTNLEGVSSSKFAKDTKVSAGIRAIVPTSKESRANGMIVNLGPTAGVSHKFDINGEDAKVLNAYTTGLSFSYSHPFTTATTATKYGTFDYSRQDTEGRTFVSDQLRGGMLVNHQLIGIWSNDLQITPKLTFGLSAILINQWKHTPKEDVTIQTAAGPTLVPRDPNATSFVQQTWMLATLDYQLFDEVGLGIGYYNLANIIAPNGQRRGVVGGDNIWWSPDARVFFDVTVNLDKMYLWATGQKKSEEKKASIGTKQANTQRLMQSAQ